MSVKLLAVGARLGFFVFVFIITTDTVEILNVPISNTSAVMARISPKLMLDSFVLLTSPEQ